jgi:hypothetical protein
MGRKLPPSKAFLPGFLPFLTGHRDDTKCEKIFVMANGENLLQQRIFVRSCDAECFGLV